MIPLRRNTLITNSITMNRRPRNVRALTRMLSRKMIRLYVLFPIERIEVFTELRTQNESTPDTPTTLTPTFTREHSISPCSTVHCDDTNQLTHKSSPSQEAPTETIYHDSKTSIRILCAYFALFVFGWGDGGERTFVLLERLTHSHNSDRHHTSM